MTVGFFEVIRQGDLPLAGSTTPGPTTSSAWSWGSSTAGTPATAAFFLVDRTRAGVGFNPSLPGDFRAWSSTAS
ncbi:MAG: hypothetical protein U0835_12285 [Isosphaeraceae bacterium]